MEINETSRNERKNEDVEKDSDEDEELDDDEFEVDRILNVAVMDGEVKYQVIQSNRFEIYFLRQSLP